MQVYDTISQARPAGRRSAVALGYFDGLHIGHAAVIRRAAGLAGEELCPAVFTFTVRGERPEKKCTGCTLLMPEQKERILRDWGVELVLSPEFSAFQGMAPEEFEEEILIRRLDAAVVCCGEDFRFGRRAAGDVKELAAFCAGHGIRLEIVPEVRVDGERVSSTRIRELLGAGEVSGANRLLGRAFGYDFTVVPGKKLGRTLDSPTINQRFPADFVPLRHGVYASVSLAEGKWLPSVTNIGLRPTVEHSDAVNSETYICGYSGDLYGQRIEVRLLSFLRPEQKFSGVEELKARIQADARAALPVANAYLAGEMRPK